MLSLTVYLNNTTEEQFRNWLYDTLNKARQTYYPDNKWIISFHVRWASYIPPDARFISLGAEILERVKTPGGAEEVYLFQRHDSIVIKWLEVGQRLRVMFRCATVLYMPAVFDILEVMARDWTETRRDIWEFVNEAAAKYNVRFATSEYGDLYALDVSRFPAPQESVELPQNDNAPQEAETPPHAETVTVDVSRKPPGRKVDEWNPIAYDILNDGGENAKERAFTKWCEMRGLLKPGRNERKAFGKAMNREKERRMKKQKR
jgi:hypothetical protein